MVKRGDTCNDGADDGGEDFNDDSYSSPKPEIHMITWNDGCDDNDNIDNDAEIYFYFYFSFVFIFADRNDEDGWNRDFPWTIVMLIVIVIIICNDDDEEEKRNVVQSIINILPTNDQLAWYLWHISMINQWSVQKFPHDKIILQKYFDSTISCL